MTLRDGALDSPRWVQLPWDSDHFGLSIGRLLLPEVSEVDLTAALLSADAAGVRCLYWLSDPDEAQVALGRQAGFKKVDVRVELALDLASQPFAMKRAPGIRRAVDSDLLSLKTLASRSHRNTRFYTDTSFSKDRADAMYAVWIERSFNDPTQTVLVSGPPGEPDGYIAFGASEEGQGAIGLIAVAELQRASGIGSALVSTAIRRLAEQGISQIEVVTQGDNDAARRLYDGMGFTERKRFIWLHRWTAG